jgi:flotillin
VDHITIVSTGNDDAAGVHKITGDMTRIAAQVPALFEALSGVDIKQLMANVQGIKTKTKSDKPADDK